MTPAGQGVIIWESTAREPRPMMTLRPVYNIQTKDLEWFATATGVYLKTVKVQTYFDKLYNISHEVKAPTW